jgi:hypothetical protein
MSKGRGAGRPPSYRAEFAEQAFRLCLLGATDAALAAAFGVDERTVNRWKVGHPAFCQSLKDGKAEADAKVAQSLYRRALGYEHDAVKIVADAKTGAEHIVPYVERYPPDTVACIFWLKNRQKTSWRDKQEHEHTGPNGGPIEIQEMTDAELVTRARTQAQRLMVRPQRGPVPAVANGNGKPHSNGDGNGNGRR